MKQIALFIIAMIALGSLPSCTISLDNRGLPFMVSTQPITVGTGMSPRGPISGRLLAHGSAGVFGQCSPQGPQTYANFQTFAPGTGPQYGNPYNNGGFARQGQQYGYPSQQYQRQHGGVYLQQTTPPVRRYPAPRQAGPGYGGVPVRWYP